MYRKLNEKSRSNDPSLNEFLGPYAIVLTQILRGSSQKNRPDLVDLKIADGIKLFRCMNLKKD